MTRYQMDDGCVVDTKKAAAHWDENTRWDGRNHISVATGTQWEHETLYRSSKGRYYIVSWSQWQGSQPTARFVDDAEAATWLLANDHDLPDDLESLADSVVE